MVTRKVPPRDGTGGGARQVSAAGAAGRAIAVTEPARHDAASVASDMAARLARRRFELLTGAPAREPVPVANPGALARFLGAAGLPTRAVLLGAGAPSGLDVSTLAEWPAGGVLLADDLSWVALVPPQGGAQVLTFGGDSAR